MATSSDRPGDRREPPPGTWEPYYEDEPLPLRHYARVVIRRWWVVALVFLLFVGYVAFGAARSDPQYEARTRLLVIQPVSERLGEDGGVAVKSLSVDVLRTLGSANDLLAEIIRTVDLRDADSGDPWTVERLARDISIVVETTSAGNNQEPLPLITMRVRGGEPPQLKEIADAWAELFATRNSLFLADEAARTYDFFVEQFNLTQAEIQAKQQERTDYVRENRTATLESRLTVLTESYQAFVGDLEGSRAALVREQSTLDADRAALAAESPAVDLTETISNDVLLLLLSANPQAVDPADFPELVSISQAINPVYFELLGRVAASEAEVAALQSSIAYLEVEVEALSAEVDDLSAELATVQATLGRIDRELEILDADFAQLGQAVQEARIAREEQAGAIQVVEEAVVPSQALGSGRTQSLILAAFLGLLVGVVAALLLEFVLSLRDEDKRNAGRSEDSAPADAEAT
jgi:uncharacterized protein involved in exopolysaccharide biosynthesis